MGSEQAQGSSPRLDLAVLREGIKPGISPIFGAACAEAGAVCLDDRNHTSGVMLAVSCSFAVSKDAAHGCELHWEPATEQSRRTWNDEQVATEHGAYGLAFLLVRLITGLTVIERSRKGTGFDYWLGSDDSLFQGKARLEVSGLRRGNDSQVDSRVRGKLGQTDRSEKSGLPAYVVVVEFSRPLSRVVRK